MKLIQPLFFIAAVSIFVFAPTKAWATLPPGATAPTISPSQLANAMVTAYQYGPGIWVPTNLGSTTQKVSVPVAPLDCNPPDTTSGIPVGSCKFTCQSNRDLKYAESYSLLTPYSGFIPGEVALYPSNSCEKMNQTFLVGISGAEATGQNAFSWAQNLLNAFVAAQSKNMKISTESSGAMLLWGLNWLIQYALHSHPTPSNQYLDEAARQIFWRHNLQSASYRAIGLDPMWPAQNLALGIPAGVADYYVSVYSKFFYNEGLKNPNILGLLYKVFAANLSYQSGLVDFRYAPIDPSCRYKDVNGNCQPIPANDMKALYYEWQNGSLPLDQNPWLVNFGTSGDFITAYDLIKFFCAHPEAAAIGIAQGNSSEFVKETTTTLGTLGASYPNSLTTTVATAKTLFDKAWGIWNRLDSVQQQLPAGPRILQPRVSAALIVAADLVGKRVDPIFWGTLAEQEQYTMDTQPSQYKIWANNLLANKAFALQFERSLFDYGSFRQPNSLYTPQWNPSSLDDLLKNALDNSTLALVRGPAGLDSIDGERFEPASEYDNGVPNPSPLKPMPYPNAFLEVAESGHAVIDGRLLFTTNGNVHSFDIDDSLSQNYLPFEKAVLRTYQKTAALSILSTSLSNLQSKIVSMSAKTQSQIGAPLPSWVTKAEGDYQNTVGASEPLNPNASDSRYFQPSLEYWLVIADKLNENGLDTLANYYPPELTSVTYNFQKVGKPDPTNGIQYGLMNIASLKIANSNGSSYIQPSGSAGPVSNAMPLNSYKDCTTSTNASCFAHPTDFVNDVIATRNEAILHPFITTTNPFH